MLEGSDPETRGKIRRRYEDMGQEMLALLNPEMAKATWGTTPEALAGQDQALAMMRAWTGGEGESV